MWLLCSNNGWISIFKTVYRKTNKIKQPEKADICFAAKKPETLIQPVFQQKICQKHCVSSVNDIARRAGIYQQTFFVMISCLTGRSGKAFEIQSFKIKMRLP